METRAIDALQPAAMLERALGILGRAIDSAQGYKPTEQQRDAGNLMLKQFLHSASALQLSRGVQLDRVGYRDGVTLDHASIQILGRAALETYLTLFHVFVESVDDDDREFRYCAWRLAGYAYINQAPLPPLTQNHRQNRDGIIAHNERFRSRIRATERFKRLTPKQQEEILTRNDRWRGRRWTAIAAAAGSGSKWSQSVYTIFSGQAHSSSHSVDLVPLGHDNDAETKRVHLSLFAHSLFVSKMTLDAAKVLPPASAYLDSSEAEMRFLNNLSAALQVIDDKREEREDQCSER